MKKKFFLVGALVAMSMSALFVACEKNEESGSLANGCTCTGTDADGTETWFIPGTYMQQIAKVMLEEEGYKVNSCADYATFMTTDDDYWSSMTCK